MKDWRQKEANETTALQARAAAQGMPTPPANTGTGVASPRKAPELYSEEECHPRLLLVARGEKGTQ